MSTVRGMFTSTENQNVFNSAHTQVHAPTARHSSARNRRSHGAGQMSQQQDGAGGKGQALAMKSMLGKAEEQQLYTFIYETRN